MIKDHYTTDLLQIHRRDACIVKRLHLSWQIAIPSMDIIDLFAHLMAQKQV